LGQGDSRRADYNQGVPTVKMPTFGYGNDQSFEHGDRKAADAEAGERNRLSRSGSETDTRSHQF
jgi:hypothetical protein